MHRSNEKWKRKTGRKIMSEVKSRRIRMDDGFRKFWNDHFTCIPPSYTHHTWYIIHIIKVAIFATKNHFQYLQFAVVFYSGLKTTKKFAVIKCEIENITSSLDVDVDAFLHLCLHMRVYRIAGSSSHSVNDTNSLNYLRK